MRMLNLRLIFVSIVWGVNFAVVKSSLADFPPMGFTVLRFSISSLALVLFMLAVREPLAMERKNRGKFISLGLIGITLYNLFFMYGLKYTTASNSALFISTSPLFAAIIQTMSGKERLSPLSAAGMVVSFIGVLMIMSGKAEAVSFSFQNLRGDLLTLCGAVFWALYTMKAGPLLEKYSPVKVTAYSMASGTVMLLPFGLYDLAGLQWGGISTLSWSGLLFASLIAGGLAFTLWYEGVKKAGVMRTIVYHYMVPLVAVAFAAVFLKERITAPQIAGGILVLSGVYIVQMRKS